MNYKNNFRIAVLFVLMIGMNVQNIQADEEVNLKLLLKPDQKYVMRMTRKMNFSQTDDGQVSKETEEKIVEVVFDVQEVDSQGNILMKVTFEKFKIKKKSSGQTIDFDSSKQAAGPYNIYVGMHRALIGESFKVKVASNGKIVKFDPFDDIIGKTAEKVIAAENEKLDKSAIRKKDKQSGGRAKRIEKTKSFIEMFFFRKDNIRPMMQSFIQILPSVGVKAGDSWKSGIDIEALQGVRLKLKNTLKKQEKGKLIIDSFYKRTLDNRPIRDKSYPGMIFTIIDYRGTVQIDKSSGWIIHKEVKTSFSAELKNQGKTTPMSAKIVKIIEPVESTTSR